MADSDTLRAVDPAALDDCSLAQAEAEIVLRRILDQWVKMGYLDAPEPVRAAIAAEYGHAIRLVLKRLAFATYCRARDSGQPASIHDQPTKPPPSLTTLPAPEGPPRGPRG